MLYIYFEDVPVKLCKSIFKPGHAAIVIDCCIALTTLCKSLISVVVQ